MTTLYVRHDVNTIAEINALALTDGEENGAFVLSKYGDRCWLHTHGGYAHWDYDNSDGGSEIFDGEPVTVLVPTDLPTPDPCSTLSPTAPGRARAGKEDMITETTTTTSVRLQVTPRGTDLQELRDFVDATQEFPADARVHLEHLHQGSSLAQIRVQYKGVAS